MTDTCANCAFWRRGFRDQETGEWLMLKRDSAQPNMLGRCRKEPCYIERHQDDWCGCHDHKDEGAYRK